MDMEKEGLKLQADDLKKQIHELHLLLEASKAESIALKHALDVAVGENRLMRQDRNYTEEAA